MHQGQGLGKIRLEAQRARDSAGNLRDLERMRQAIAEVVGVACGENLRLRFQAPEGARVNHPVTVARVVVAVGVGRFEITAAARMAHVHRVGG